MTGDKDFQRRLELIERGIQQLESTADPGQRAAAQQLMQAILELHGRSLERLLEIVHASALGGPAIIDELGADPLVAPLLILHSLHPLTLEARVLQALGAARPSLRAVGAEAELVSVREGVVRIRLLGGAAQKSAIEEAILDTAPDAVRVDVDGTPENVVGFVPLGSLRPAEGSPRGARSAPQPAIHSA